MTGFYEELRGVADELFGEFKQGSVQLRRVTTTPGPNEWDPPTETTETWELGAAVKRVDQRYENGILIVQTGDIVTFAVPPVAPILSDGLVIDGTLRAITSLRPTPSAGTVVAWEVFCAA
ncbi:hypothetical protein [Mesorhizobium sp. Pch-S]|uniref:hypothetical protein n=1 Tax=Mesorhizobium sp. Pch-S TaxID=2082387 RepID=UPI00101236C4|nr:hypothetical protein [Mesorhizobium sp. Pch-S]QAZ45950.1 hypothetical protein C1M53_26565 [Mesorhizobium sp. Pch-S]